MINYLKLTNFKRHENLELLFTAGLNLIRAGNEHGKSSMLHAIAYALFGARALPMSLAETVTYGKPESTLRVLLRFSFNGSEFEIERHKGGAELRGDGVVASGQAEVTAFVERLFGCSAAVANSLMFANQGALRGALEGGPGVAVSLIEKLADVDALDRLGEKAQADLPSGNTKMIEARIASLASIEAPTADFTELEAALSAAQVEAFVSSAEVAQCQAKIAAADIAGANRDIANANAAVKRVDMLKQSRLGYEHIISMSVVPELQDVDALREKATAQAAAATLRQQYAAFLKIDQYEHVAESQESVVAKGQALTSRQTAIQASLRTLTRELAQAEMAIIKGNLCDFCGKDFKDVPEVIAKNARCQALAEAAQAQMAALEVEAKAIAAELQDVALTIQATNTLATQMSQLPVEAFGGYPRKYRWVGGDIPAEDSTDYAKAVKAADAANREAQTLLATIASAKKNLAELDVEGAEAEASTLCLLRMAAQELLTEAAQWATDLQAAQAQDKVAAGVLAEAKSKLAVAQAQFAEAQRHHAAALVELDKARADLSVYLLNNRVIKKIRDARPLVAKQLWSIVLGTVSHYFSQIRGVPSTVTREGTGFLVDGKACAGLSGSTLDALGLSIRIALTRTFLPNVPWLILDEPAAACDADREAAMLGVVAGAGFPQVLTVSHSDLGEAYASNVITF